MGARLAEVARFLAVGGVATVVAFVLFNLLLHGWGTHALLGDYPVTAYVVANTVGMVISYHLSRTWAFKHREPSAADGGVTAYVVINVVTMTLPVACLMFSRRVLGLDDPLADNISANVVGLMAGQAARYHLFRRFVFNQPHPRDDVGEREYVGR